MEDDFSSGSWEKEKGDFGPGAAYSVSPVLPDHGPDAEQERLTLAQRDNSRSPKMVWVVSRTVKLTATNKCILSLAI